MSIRFGTAGTSESFKAMGYKDSLDVPEYTAKFGLNAFEYQCGRGVRLGEAKAKVMAQRAAEGDILFSLHAPYFISMSSLEEEKRLNSINYILDSCGAVKSLGGRRVIFHSGSCGKQSREAALEKALDTLHRMPWTRPVTANLPSARKPWARWGSWARWTRCWPCAAWTSALPPALTSAT